MDTPGLRAARRRALLTQGELATSAKVSRATVARMEAGGVARFVTIRRLAKALGVEATELTGPASDDTGDDASGDR